MQNSLERVQPSVIHFLEEGCSFTHARKKTLSSEDLVGQRRSKVGGKKVETSKVKFAAFMIMPLSPHSSLNTFSGICSNVPSGAECT